MNKIGLNKSFGTDASGDIRSVIFNAVSDCLVTACIYADMDGILSGSDKAAQKARDIGVTVEYILEEGAEVQANDLIMQIKGAPVQIVEAEDTLIGCLSKCSGVATAAAKFREHAGEDMRVVCGSWKKMLSEMKTELRQAIITGGVSCRISDEPMVYLDKNYVEILGGIQMSLGAVSGLEGRKKVIQIKGRYEYGDLVREAWSAVNAGADIVYIDTGRIEDAEIVVSELKPVLNSWRKEYGYRHVLFAYGGNVKLSDISRIKKAGVDIVGVGKSIIDAPLLDMRMEVTRVDAPKRMGHSYSMLSKSELKIEGVRLEKCNLTEIANAVADEMQLDRSEVLVIDVRDHAVAFDILKKNLDPYTFVGKETAILEKLSEINGVHLSPNAHLSSDGMLGWIMGDDELSQEMQAQLDCAAVSGLEAAEHIKKRILIYPSGAEVESGEIEDTNTPLLKDRLTQAGFEVDCGAVLKDDIDLFSGKLRQALSEGYGVVITTGGVGAENKDHSVEAIERLDRNAATPYIAKFEQNHGRHRKPGIRIGVGQVELTTFVALPGPNDEVSLCVDTLIKGITAGWSKEMLAASLAKILRAHLREKLSVSRDKSAIERHLN